MKRFSSVDDFLSNYDQEIQEQIHLIRDVLLENLPGVTEQLDVPAKMIAYVYGPRYVDMVCTIIPSRKGIKLGFYKGADLSDPDHLLEGSGKISRYVEIREHKQIKSEALKKLIETAFEAYKKRTGK